MMFEQFSNEFNKGDYAKEFIPGWGYVFYKIIEVKKYPNFKGKPIFYKYLFLPTEKERVCNHNNTSGWILSSEKEYEEYLIKRDIKKYNL